MYLTTDAVISAIQILTTRVHPFLGITFLACKANELPVGRETTISVDGLTNDHLSIFHRVDRTTEHFFQPFKSVRFWVSARYASTGLQTANTQTFIPVFLHKRRSKTWGFSTDYINQIGKILTENNLPQRAPSWPLAVWLFKDVNLKTSMEPRRLIELFYESFNITEAERDFLFDDDLSNISLPLDAPFSETPLVMADVLEHFPPPPDNAKKPVGLLASMSIQHTELSSSLSMEFGDRLTLITGDNGLGKSFLLEFAWWITTGEWADKPAYPYRSQRIGVPRVEYELKESPERRISGGFVFNQMRNNWTLTASTPHLSALCLFARADGSFAAFDPVRNQLQGISGESVGRLTSDQVWNGKPGLIEGLIRDWVRWQKADDSTSFSRFCDVLRRLSPQDLGQLTPDAPIRIPGDPRDMPTIRHNYGTVPIVHASSGVQRILQLAYLIIWSWQEHELAASQASTQPLRRLLVFVDELEAHLHPKWQRMVLPSLMAITDLLSENLSIQSVVATHSPMILASIEPDFDPTQDVLYHLFAHADDVRLDEMPFVKYGDASGWLTSPVFGLQHARSRQAEQAIERAKALQMAEEVDANAVKELTEELRRVLPNEDSFWPRWLYFAESHGALL